LLTHYRRELTARQNVGRPLSVDVHTWQFLNETIAQRYEEHCPMTTDDALDFLAHEFGLHLLPIRFGRRYPSIANSV
jgi:hypothetical protein